MPRLAEKVSVSSNYIDKILKTSFVLFSSIPNGFQSRRKVTVREYSVEEKNNNMMWLKSLK